MPRRRNPSMETITSPPRLSTRNSSKTVLRELRAASRVRFDSFRSAPLPIELAQFREHRADDLAGVAHYYDLHAGGAVVKDVAWYYPEPKSGMAKIKDHVAFYKTKVQIS